MGCGSSPHTRGTRHRGRQACRKGRFIPAYAGNARLVLACNGGASVHPRIRGERVCRCRIGQRHTGSSPHTRGTPRRGARRRADRRFIPAYAGNALFQKPKLNMRPVHPRIRGERGAQPNTPVRRVGSSPHTRGTHGLPITGRWRWRFIPAYAGNAPYTSATGTIWTVHPRIRGERIP